MKMKRRTLLKGFVGAAGAVATGVLADAAGLPKAKISGFVITKRLPMPPAGQISSSRSSIRVRM